MYETEVVKLFGEFERFCAFCVNAKLLREVSRGKAVTGATEFGLGGIANANWKRLLINWRWGMSCVGQINQTWHFNKQSTRYAVSTPWIPSTDRNAKFRESPTFILAFSGTSTWNLIMPLALTVTEGKHGRSKPKVKAVRLHAPFMLKARRYFYSWMLHFLD